MCPFIYARLYSRTRSPLRAAPAILRMILHRYFGIRTGLVVQWKYILFEHNDSEEEIRAAQRLAARYGVDQILFVLSHTWHRSRKYTSLSQIEKDPVFHRFRGAQKFQSTVGKEVDNVRLWEEEAQRRGQE